MTKPRVLVFDSDGVISIRRKILPGAADFFSCLNTIRYPYFVMTNHPCLDKKKKSAFYKKLGICISPERIIGAADPLGNWLKDYPLSGKKVYAIGVENPALYLKKLGLVTANAESPEKLSAVILFDDDFHWSFQRLAEVFNILLQNPSIPVIIPNPDLLFPLRSARKNNKNKQEEPVYFFPTSGILRPMIESLCHAKGIEPKIFFLGKPFAPVYREAQTRIQKVFGKTPPSRIAMIGDTPAIDIFGAKRMGWTTYLIKTGNYLYGKGKPGCRADKTFNGLADLARFLKLTL